jgi:hypothetical protein
MKTCNGCKYAKWKRTKTGKKHPSGEGRCTYEVKLPVMPNSKYFSTFSGSVSIDGGLINRKKQYDNHCPCYCPKT